MALHHALDPQVPVAVLQLGHNMGGGSRSGGGQTAAPRLQLFPYPGQHARSESGFLFAPAMCSGLGNPACPLLHFHS